MRRLGPVPHVLAQAEDLHDLIAARCEHAGSAAFPNNLRAAMLGRLRDGACRTMLDGEPSPTAIAARGPKTPLVKGAKTK